MVYSAFVAVCNYSFSTLPIDSVFLYLEHFNLPFFTFPLFIHSGEFTCDKRVSVIKVHPHTHSFDELNSGFFGSDDGKCERGGISRFKQAVLLIRNPFDAIWSEYQRRVTRSHVQGEVVNEEYSRVKKIDSILEQHM